MGWCDDRLPASEAGSGSGCAGSAAAAAASAAAGNADLPGRFGDLGDRGLPGPAAAAAAAAARSRARLSVKASQDWGGGSSDPPLFSFVRHPDGLGCHSSAIALDSRS